MTQMLKNTAIIFFILCFFLPMSSCSGRSYYVATGFDDSWQTALLSIPAFIWPLFIFIYRKIIIKSFHFILSVFIIEVVFCIYSGGAILAFQIMTDIKIGLIVAYIGLCLYVIALIRELVLFRKNIQKT